MSNTNDISFKWSNYLKATPANVQYFALALKSVLATITGTTIVEQAAWYYSLPLLILTVVVDEVGKFAGRVSGEASQVVSVEFPVTIADQVEVKQEIVEPKKP